MIGHSEEGREILLVAISDGANIAQLDHYKDLTARLADLVDPLESHAAADIANNPM